MIIYISSIIWRFNTVNRGDDTIRKPVVFILIICLFSVTFLAGCTTENHRMIVTIKNNRDTTQNIEFHVDDRVEITTSIEPSASVEREYELSPGQHSFILFHEVNGTLELYQARNLKIESDDSLFFELE